MTEWKYFSNDKRTLHIRLTYVCNFGRKYTWHWIANEKFDVLVYYILSLTSYSVRGNNVWINVEIPNNGKYIYI